MNKNTIFIYGDSASASELDHIAPGWAKMLSDRLDFELLNRAVSGGSTENAFNNFTGDYLSSLFKDGDLIVFQFSTVGRLFLNHQTEFPRTASLYLNPPKFLDKKEHRWYFENKEYLEWYVVNHNLRINDISQAAYKHVLKNLAESNPGVTIVILELDKKQIDFPLGNIPTNFFAPNFELHKVFSNEIKSRLQYFDWVKYTGWDPRINHMSIPNLIKVANLIYDLYTRRIDIEDYNGYFIEDCFEQIKNKEDYKSYARHGLLYDYEFEGFKFA
jgi:hypothetical protein